MKKLVLKSMISYELESKGETLETWQPYNKGHIFNSLDIAMEIGFENEDATDIFYVMLINLHMFNQNSNKFDKTRIMTISEYNFTVIKDNILEVLKKCTRNTWEDSCAELQKYFLWEYDDYK